MNELYTVNYKDEGPFFLSNFGQITRCVRIHGVHNEEAIDRNTAAIPIVCFTSCPLSEHGCPENAISWSAGCGP